MRKLLKNLHLKLRKIPLVSTNPICFGKITSDAKGLNAYNPTDSVVEILNNRKNLKNAYSKEAIKIK